MLLPAINGGLRLATESDIPALELLIPLSVRTLQAAFYSPAQMEAALGAVFAVDRQLIGDATYFVIEEAGRLVGCGGWSRRRADFGGGLARPDSAPPLDPAVEPARIRAFFVHPDWARRGLGRCLLGACEDALRGAGFQSAVLVATLAGQPLYAAFGYRVIERFEIPLAGAPSLPVVRMSRRFEGPAGRLDLTGATP